MCRLLQQSPHVRCKLRENARYTALLFIFYCSIAVLLLLGLEWGVINFLKKKTLQYLHWIGFSNFLSLFFRHLSKKTCASVFKSFRNFELLKLPKILFMGPLMPWRHGKPQSHHRIVILSIFGIWKINISSKQPLFFNANVAMVTKC